MVKAQYVQVLIDLAFVNGAKLNPQFQFEFASSLPLVGLLWTILSKVSKPSETKEIRVSTNDVFTILAAILDLQVQDLLKKKDQVVRSTANPLLCRNSDNSLLFQSYSDLAKFSVKFQNFKNNYKENIQIRTETIKKADDG